MMIRHRADQEKHHAGRILLVTSSFPRWEGDSTTPFVLHLAQDLQALGWTIEVLAPHAPGARRRETLSGVIVRRFRYLFPEAQQTVCYQGGALINLRKNRANLFKLPVLVICEWLNVVSLIAGHKFDLVHSHWVLPQGFVGVLATRLFSIPHVITVHGGDVFGLQGVFLTALKRFAFRRATAVTVNSSATNTAVGQIASKLENISLIPMGVTSTEQSNNIDPSVLRKRFVRKDGPLLIFVGRIVDEKGVGDLLHATSMLTRNLPDTTTMIVGEGQDREKMERLSETLGLSDRVKFVGWVRPEEIHSYFSAADIFVGPSKTASDGWVEAQGLTFVEAMLARIPVIATDVGGIPDTVQHEKTGLLVKENSPKEIAAAVERLVRDPDLTARLIEAGQKLALENFTREASAQKFSELFRKLLSN